MVSLFLTKCANTVIVSETEEELYSDEDEKRAKLNKSKKIKVFSLGYFSQLMNKKIYSDDFDMSSDNKIRKQQKQNAAGSLMEYPISEDVESENDDNNYLSDYSGSSTFSFKKKKMSFDLSRLIDKLEPSAFDDSASSLLGGGSKYYYSNVNETIQEEDDEDVLAPPGSIASGKYSRLKAQHDRSASFKFLNLGSYAKPKKIKSICLESEPILEELDEYNGAHEFAD